jgi:hypothetical protein
MGTVAFVVINRDMLNFYENPFEFITIYLPILLQLKQAYLACTSLLFVSEIARFVLNLFNYGKSLNTKNEMETLTKVFHGIYNAIMVLEAIFHLGFVVIFIEFHIYGLTFYLEPAFAASMVY